MDHECSAGNAVVCPQGGLVLHADAAGVKGCEQVERDDLAAALRQQLQQACGAVLDNSMLGKGQYSGGGSNSLGSSTLTAAQAEAGLAASTLRLLKLLSLQVLDLRRVAVGGMISKGAFSEIFSGTVGCVMWQPSTGATISQMAAHVLVGRSKQHQHAFFACSSLCSIHEMWASLSIDCWLTSSHSSI